MSKKRKLTTPEQTVPDLSAMNGTTNGHRAESCAHTTVDESVVAELAYHFWLNRGCPDGSPEEDWFLAERELRRPADAA